MIEIRNLSKTFENGSEIHQIFKDVNIVFPEDGFIFISGRSGVGKSTLLNLIAGLDSHQGEIVFDKTAVNIDVYRRKNLGLVFQDFLLMENLSVEENITQALLISGLNDEKEIKNRIARSLEQVGLSFNPSRPASSLSLGQKQRLALARVLAVNPKTILLDEPTTNLDINNSLLIMNLLKSLSKDHLLICACHNRNLIKLYADRVYEIDNQRIEETPLDQFEAPEQAYLSAKDSYQSPMPNTEIPVLDQDVPSHQKRSIGKNFLDSFLKRRNKISNLLSLALPLISFIILNAVIGSFESSQNSGLERYCPDNQIALVPISSQQNNPVPLSSLSKWLGEEESCLIDTDIYNPFLKTDGTKESSSSPKLFLSSDRFSFSSSSVSQESISFESATPLSIEKYKKVPELKEILSAFDLKDNEVVFDKSIFQEAFKKKPLFSESLEKTVLGSTFIFNNFFEQEVFTVKGLVDTHAHGVYLSDKMSEKIRKQNFGFNGSAENAFSDYKQLFDLDDTILIDYQTAKNSSDYSFSKADSSLDDSVFFKSCLENKNSPACFASTSAKKVIQQYLGQPLNPSLSFDSNTIVNYLPDPSKKVICFTDYQGSNGTVNSQKKFFAISVRSKIYNSAETFKVTPELVSGQLPSSYNDFLIPSSIFTHFSSLDEINDLISANLFVYNQYSFSSSMVTNSFVPRVSGVYSSSSLSDPLLITQELETRLEGINDFIPTYGSSNWKDNVSSTLGKSSFLISTNPKTTQKYLQEDQEFQSLHLKALTYREAINETVGQENVSSARISLAIFSVLIVVFIALVALDSISTIKQDKKEIGILRCLGMSKKELFISYFKKALSDWSISCVLPILLATIVLLSINIYCLSWYLILFLFGLLLIKTASTSIPLLYLLKQSPSQIMKKN
ncbi:MAG: ATP-binding cassette domain-containing protein [Bacilli bacterium]|jgi:ABC-type lipoprotein export system ATPase subunit|nr:ATP-binding cassette domain-containing protein [Bacilli bacterium]